MLVQSPATTRPSLGRAASAPARSTTRRGLLGRLAELIERAGQREAASSTTMFADRYWTTIARGL